MACLDDYITINSSTPSRSGLYASDLPGIDTDLLTGIARETTDDHDDIWPVIYRRSTRNLVQDVSKNLQDKFFVDFKLLARETSKYTDTYNSGSSLAGVTLEFILPKYARLHIISVDAFSQGAVASGDVFKVYDTDEDGELLYTHTAAVASGRNSFKVDEDFEVDKVFIAYNPATYSFKQTENKYYASGYNHFDAVVCDFCLYDSQYRGAVVQVNYGGLNVKYLVYCSVEKFVCENIKLFEDSLWYKIGQEITVERRFGERLNQFTIMTQERNEELMNFYKAQYEMNLMNAIKSHNIIEDPYCFSCKNTVTTDYQLP
jgi:hypothetical protein